MSTRVIRFTNSAASIGQLSWTPDQDVVATGFWVRGMSAVLSLDPSMTVALLTAPSATQVVERIEIDASQEFTPFRIPLSAGEKVFVAFTAAKGTAYLYCENVS